VKLETLLDCGVTFYFLKGKHFPAVKESRYCCGAYGAYFTI